MKALIDTCILIDLLQKREPFFKNAHEVFLAAAGYQFEGYITARSVLDVYYLMHRVFHDDKKTRDALASLFKLFRVSDTAGSDCQLAILSPVGDYEDAVMTETALRTNMDCIVTRNLQDYKNSAVPIFSPEDFLRMM